MKKVLFLLSALTLQACAQNTWQTLFPKRNNVAAGVCAGSTGSTTLPQTSEIIIQTPFDGSLTSTVGPSPTFSRTLVKYYPDTTSTIAEVLSGTPSYYVDIYYDANPQYITDEWNSRKASFGR